MAILTLIAQQTPPNAESVGPWVQGGALTLLAMVLWWVMGRQTDAIKEVGTKVDNRMDNHGAKLDKVDSRLNKLVNAVLLDTLRSENTSPAVKAQAEKLFSEKDDA